MHMTVLMSLCWWFEKIEIMSLCTAWKYADDRLLLVIGMEIVCFILSSNQYTLTLVYTLQTTNGFWWDHNVFPNFTAEFALGRIFILLCRQMCMSYSWQCLSVFRKLDYLKTWLWYNCVWQYWPYLSALKCV